MRNIILTLTFLIAAIFSGDAQFHLLNDAVQLDENTWRITNATASQKGQMWHQDPIDLSQDFEVRFRINMGSSVTGGDGLTFTLQTSCLSAGGHASAMGVNGIEPALSLEFDTYFNSSRNDPDASHIALFKNGGNFHGSEDQLSNDIGNNNVGVNNMENGVWRDVIITWEAESQTFALNYSGFDLLSHSSDIVNDIFGGSTAVYWGFTGSTGAAVNVQRVEMVQYPENILELSDKVICPGDSVQNGFLLTGNYTWMGDGVSDSGLAQPWFTALEDTQYTLFFEDSCGYSSEYNFNLIVEQVPDVNISIDGESTICEGNSALLSADLEEGQSIQWFANGEEITEANDSNLEVSASGEYFARVITENGCEAISNSIQLEVVQPPLVDLNIDLDQACPGEEVNLFTVLEESESIIWYLDGEILEGEIDSVLTTTVPGDYSILVSNAEDCNSLSETVSFSHYPVPESSSIEGNSVISCDVLEEVYSVDFNEGSDYEWAVPDGAEIISGEGSNSVTVNFNDNFGEISVIESNEFGCQGDSVFIEVSCEGTSVEEHLYHSIQIYPNPVLSSFRLDDRFVGSQLRLMDSSAKVVRDILLRNVEVDISELEQGLYIGLIQLAGNTYRFRLVKQ